MVFRVQILWDEAGLALFTVLFTARFYGVFYSAFLTAPS
jgi:hypothetical protein